MSELFVTEALERVSTDQAGPGEIIAVAGIPEVTIGETSPDPEDPRPLPVIGSMNLSLSIVVRNQHFAGWRGGTATRSPPPDPRSAWGAAWQCGDRGAADRPARMPGKSRDGRGQLVIARDDATRKVFTTAGQPRVLLPAMSTAR